MYKSQELPTDEGSSFQVRVSVYNVMGYVQEKCTGLVSEASFVIAKPREIGTEQKTHQIESS